MNSSTRHCLHYGESRLPLAHVVPDDEWPGMFRVAWPDGSQSDMVNASRAKDAAEVIAERGPPARNRRRFHWRQERSDRPSEAAQARLKRSDHAKPHEAAAVAQ